MENESVHKGERTPARVTDEILKEFDRKRSDPIGEENHNGKNNVILSKNLRLSLDTKHSCRNLSTVLYGHNNEKAYFAPNILQANASYIVQDVSGELYYSCEDYLKEHGYDVKCVTPEELSGITREEVSSFGFSKKALFVNQPMGDSTMAPEIAGFFSDAMKVLTFHYEKNERPAVHTVHTEIMIPDQEILPAIPVLSDKTGGEVLGTMRLYDVSLQIGIQHRTAFMDLYPGTYPVIEGNSDSVIYLGDIGCKAWNEKNHADPDAETFFMENECLVAVRGTQPYIDEQYDVYTDDRYRN